MPPVSAPVFAGRPAFSRADWAATESAAGAQAAWQAALQGPAQEALRNAQGQFALAMTDDQGRSLLAVDRFATEAICYRQQGTELRWSTAANALADAQSEIDLQSIFDYLYFHAIPSPRTIFRGVSRLPAGHLAEHRDGQLQVQAYWRPSFDARPFESFAAARQEFRRLLEQAVKSQLDGSRPACFLSGGTDSSTVAGMMRLVTGQAPMSHSVGFEAAGYDEMEYARIAAKHFGCEHHEHYITPADLVRLIPKVAAHHDQPFGNSSALPTYFCAEKAHGAGVTRLLAGDGGDELFGGNTRYAKQWVFSLYDKVPAGLRQGLLEPVARTSIAARIPVLKKGVSYVRQALVPMPDRLQTYNLLHRLGLDKVLTPQLLKQVDRAAPEQDQRAVWQGSEGASFVNRMLAYDWHYTLAENDLPKVRGGTAMAGVSVGYPLLDTALVDFSARLPDNYKLRGLKLRWFFKEALRGFLPDAILTKKKHGFGLPFGVWATQHAGLRELARDSVRGVAARGLVRAEFADELMDRFLPEHPGYYGEMVWILMMLEQWFRHHRPDWRLQG